MNELASRLSVSLFARIYRGYHATLRVTFLLTDGSTCLADEYPFRPEIWALTERDSVALAGIAGPRHFTALVAGGRDGDWATALLEAIGCHVVRGSSRHGGAQALRALILDRRNTPGSTALVVDGPLGPAGIAKGGAAALSATTGLPLVALGVAAQHQFTLKGTWAQIFIPLPFTRLAVAFEAIPVTESTTRTDLAACTEEITHALARARERATDWLGISRSSTRPTA